MKLCTLVRQGIIRDLCPNFLKLDITGMSFWWKHDMYKCGCYSTCRSSAVLSCVVIFFFFMIHSQWEWPKHLPMSGLFQLKWQRFPRLGNICLLLLNCFCAKYILASCKVQCSTYSNFQSIAQNPDFSWFTCIAHHLILRMLVKRYIARYCT